MSLLELWKNRKKILGKNERNLVYIRRYNLPKAKRIADDKLLTKKILDKAEIPTPKLIGFIENHNELQEFDWDKLPKSFVIKPVSGLEGGGIEIFYNRDKNGDWIKGDGSRFSLERIKSLASEILDGKYSLHNDPDRVFFEERIRPHKAFQYYAYKGTPDVRVIVFKGIPVMSMIRLPTKESQGKANMQLGAVGAGIDIATGTTTYAAHGKSKIVEKIPETNLNVSGLKIPYWNKILYYAIAAQKATGLNFAGVDFLIDRDNGPVIVEMNARPGLSIQIANRDGLRWRLRKVRGLKIQSIEKGIRLGKDLFGGEIEEDIERISGKNLIGIYEDITVFPLETETEIEAKSEATNKEKKLKEIKTKAKIDTGADSTSIDKDIALKLGYGPLLEHFEDLKRKHDIPEEIESTKEATAFAELLTSDLENFPGFQGSYCESVRSSHGRSLRLYTEITIKLADLVFQTKANLYDRSNLQYKVIVGRKSLGRFLVEPGRK